MKKVLVVDDTKNIRTLLTMCLEMEGYDVTAAGDGKQALELLQTAEFALAFLDIKLPEIPGTEILRRIRTLGINTPVVIMTAFATIRNAVECTKLGAVAYLQKPFSAEKVRSFIREWNPGLPEQQTNCQQYLQLAEELLLAGKLNEAYNQLKQALALNPSCGETYLLLSKFYEAQGNTKEAARFKTVAEQFK